MNKFTQEYLFDSTVVFAAAVGIMMMRFMLGTGDVCHPESSSFIQVYTEQGKSLLQIIFNPWYTDWNCYQARELSYLLDWCDAQLIKACILAKHPHFFSFVNALIIVSIAMILHSGFFYWMPKLGRLGAALLSLFSIVVPASSQVVFFRSSKPAVSLGIAISGIALWSIIRRRREAFFDQKGMWIALGVSLILMPYFDRQGLFFVSVCAMICGSLILLFSQKSISTFFDITDSDRHRLVLLMIIAAGSVFLATAYNLKIAPELIHHFNGYYPSFAYQNMGSRGSILSIFHFSGGMTFFENHVGVTIFPWDSPVSDIVGTFFLLLWLFLCYNFARNNKKGWSLLILVAGYMAAMIALANIMTARHKDLLLPDPDPIHYGYFLPCLVVLILLLAISIEITGGEKPLHLRIWVSTLSAILIAVHLFAMVTIKRDAVGPSDYHFLYSPELIRCLKDPDRDPEKTLMPYSFLQLIRYFRSMKE